MQEVTIHEALTHKTCRELTLLAKDVGILFL